MRTKKAVRPPPKSEFILGFVTHADLGKVVRSPGAKSPHNTRLDNGNGTMQSCCKCFSRTTQGACSAHNSEMYLRLMAAEAALRKADKKVEALQIAHAAGDMRAVLNAITDLIELRLPGRNRAVK